MPPVRLRSLAGPLAVAIAVPLGGCAATRVKPAAAPTAAARPPAVPVTSDEQYAVVKGRYDTPW
jgi:hypothetical protein